MTIPRNKNITKQLNNYSYVIVITLQGLLQRTKRALKDFIPSSHFFFFFYNYRILIFSALGSNAR
jgi:hypothetical protein